MALFKIENASFGYEGKTVVKDVTFDLNEGNYLCIVGENGSGKSTIMKTMLGLLSPISGKIIFGDELKQTEIGYLPQQTEIQKDFPASVMEIVLSGCLNRCGNRPFYNRKEKELAKATMERLGISTLSKRCYRELSGGQQQRVLLARALCATRKMLLLDEPVAGLDPKATADMYHIISELNKNNDITVVMISHDIHAALMYATHILHIGHSPLFYGNKDDYLKSTIGKIFVTDGGGAQDE